MFHTAKGEKEREKWDSAIHRYLW